MPAIWSVWAKVVLELESNLGARADHGCRRATTSDRRVATIKSGFRDSESRPEPLLWDRVDVFPSSPLIGIYLARLYARAFFCRAKSLRVLESDPSTHADDIGCGTPRICKTRLRVAIGASFR